MAYKIGILLLITLAGCVGQQVNPPLLVTDAGSTVQTVTVGSEVWDCVGVGTMRCLVVDGALFYDTIHGFHHESGYEYQLQIVRSQRFSPGQIPADASQYAYWLLGVLSKQDQWK